MPLLCHITFKYKLVVKIVLSTVKLRYLYNKKMEIREENTMRKKLIGAILVIVFIAMFIPSISLTTVASGNAQVAQVASVYALGSSTGSSTLSASQLRYSNSTPSSGFYAQLGTIYTVKTLDGVNIKVLRYHPPNQNFRNGSQPILLIPGIMANINYFISYSTPRLKQLYPNVTLPANLSAWAVNDKNIQKDPLLYYSIAYYLWAQGYDVWLVNYRSVGYAEMKSDMGSSTTSIDDWALYDVRAALNLVYTVTQQHPLVGGHSTGGLVTMMLLQGAYIKSDGTVGSTTALVKERNGITQGPETIKGYIALEPAGIPVITSLLNTPLTWALLNTGLYLDIRSMMETLDGTGNISLLQLLQQLLDQSGQTIRDIIENILQTDMTDFTPALAYYHFAYSLDGIYFNILEQYADFASGHTVREFFRNGFWNQFLFSPPQPHTGDGYYYYVGSNMKKMSVPMIAMLATMNNTYMDFVNSTEIIKDYINGKTFNLRDTYFFVQGAHVDAAIGIRAPTDVFPNIGTWLAVVAPHH